MRKIKDITDNEAFHCASILLSSLYKKGKWTRQEHTGEVWEQAGKGFSIVNKYNAYYVQFDFELNDIQLVYDSGSEILGQALHIDKQAKLIDYLREIEIDFSFKKT